MTLRTEAVAVVAAALVLAGCGGGGQMASSAPGGGMPAVSGTAAPIAPMGVAASTSAASLAVSSAYSRDDQDEGGGSVLPRLNELKTIGSTVDPLNGDQNPYGLDIAPTDTGLLHRGDLVVCNFNDAANVQGKGTTIVALRPDVGATPTRIAREPSLLGCTALALGPTDAIWVAAFAANDNPIVAPTGHTVTTLPGGPWHGPFGQTFAPTAGRFGDAAFYESNAGDGTIVRIDIHTGGPFTFDVIARGFAVNGGAPGSILGPSGLQYDARHDKLFVVDGADNSVTVFHHVSTIPAHGIVVHGATFSGPSANLARRIASGAPLNGPISSALLPGGHLVVGNTLDPDGTNLMVELAPNGRVVATKNVDTGPAGALFGMVASGDSPGDAQLYFNDDNDNTVKLLER
jgi:hypothetical protein